MKTLTLLPEIMNRAAILIIFFIICLLCVPATAVHAGKGLFVWTKAIGNTNFDAGNSIAVDADGNLYVTGLFQDTVDFDPGPGTTNLTSAGDYDIFVSKLDSSGNLVWARAMGGSENDMGYGIAVDVEGNVYTTGSFRGTADFNPGPVTNNLDSAGEYDVFISKLDGDGNYVWAKALKGSETNNGNDIAIDASGNIYTTGYFTGTVDFDPGSGTENRISDNGSSDIFISKLDSNGNYGWVITLGSHLGDTGYSITLDATGNVYTTGEFQGTIDFNPDPISTASLTSKGNYDIYVCKINSAGGLIWARAMGGSSSDSGYAVAADAAGNVYTTGEFWEGGPADFDPGPGTANLTSAGEYDVFISKLDSSGNYVWAKALRCTFSSCGYSITVDNQGGIYTTGNFHGLADFDPGPGTANLTAQNGDYGFISKLDSSGNYVWARALDGSSHGDGIAVDAFNNVYITGAFQGTVEFIPGPGGAHLTSVGNNDIFISKLADIFSFNMFLPAIIGEEK